MSNTIIEPKFLYMKSIIKLNDDGTIKRYKNWVKEIHGLAYKEHRGSMCLIIDLATDKPFKVDKNRVRTQKHVMDK